jgi:hypothetical protein
MTSSLVGSCARDNTATIPTSSCCSRIVERDAADAGCSRESAAVCIPLPVLELEEDFEVHPTSDCGASDALAATQAAHVSVQSGGALMPSPGAPDGIDVSVLQQQQQQQQTATESSRARDRKNGNDSRGLSLNCRSWSVTGVERRERNANQQTGKVGSFFQDYLRIYCAASQEQHRRLSQTSREKASNNETSQLLLLPSRRNNMPQCQDHNYLQSIIFTTSSIHLSQLNLSDKMKINRRLSVAVESCEVSCRNDILASV